MVEARQPSLVRLLRKRRNHSRGASLRPKTPFSGPSGSATIATRSARSAPSGRPGLLGHHARSASASQPWCAPHTQSLWAESNRKPRHRGPSPCPGLLPCVPRPPGLVVLLPFKGKSIKRKARLVTRWLAAQLFHLRLSRPLCSPSSFRVHCSKR